MTDSELIKKIKDWFAMYPPPAADGKGWKEFNKQSKENYPIRYWIDETLIPNTWYPISRFFKGIRDYIRFRFFEKMYLIDTKLKPDYYDCDERILNGMFALLIDFVEIEKAWMQAIFCEDYKKPWYPFKRFRDREMGIKYLDWEITLSGPEDNPDQAESAKQTKELYLWWVDERPKRKDPYDLMTKDLFPPGQDIFDIMSQEPKEERQKIFKEIDRLEREYFDEDTEMLTKLIKLRGSLWT